MNKAVVEFYRSGQTTTGTLKQTLVAMKNQVTAKLWVTVFSHAFSDEYVFGSGKSSRK